MADQGKSESPIPLRPGSGEMPKRQLRQFVRDWALPLAGAAIVVLVLDRFLPAEYSSVVSLLSVGFYWVPFLVLWYAAGSTLISIALWLAPAVALSVAGALGAGPVVRWLIPPLVAALFVISFYPPAIEKWGVLVTRLATAFLRRSLSPEDRDVDMDAERTRGRIWVAYEEARRSGPERFLSDLDGIRQAAADLPTRDVGGAQLKRALLGFIDALHDRASGDSAETDVREASNRYLEQLHRYRSRSTLYRIMTLRRHTEH